MSFSGAQNSVVRQFDGGIRALRYWIGNRLLSASDVVNDSTVTGTTVKAALDTLSTASTAVFPFVASGLAEKDLVSYDAGAATWKNRTVAAALSGQLTSTMVTNSSTVPGSTMTAALNQVQPNSVTWNYELRLSRPLVVNAGQTVTASAGNFILYTDDVVSADPSQTTAGAVVCTPSAVVNRDTVFTRCRRVTPTTLVSVVGTADASVASIGVNKWRVTRLTTTAVATLATITLSASSYYVFDVESNMAVSHSVTIGNIMFSTVSSPSNTRMFGAYKVVNPTATPTLNSVGGTVTIGDYFDITYVGSGTEVTTSADYTTTFTVS